MKRKNEKVVVGVSGGIDSLVSLLLLQEKGFSPIAVHLQIPHWKKDKGENLSLLKEFSKKYHFPLLILNQKKTFKEIVLKYFLESIKKGETPNPCVICNRFFKIKKLFDFAKEHKIKFVATGHYARVSWDKERKEYLLRKAKDKEKDQTYFLALLPQKWLSRLIFPLGDYTKEEVRKIAKNYKILKFVRKRESQDFCYVSSKEKNKFLLEKFGKKEGNIITENREIIGKHPGIYFFTIGQRKGIKIPSKILYVKEIHPKENTIVVTDRKDHLLKKEIFVSPFHFISPSFSKERKIQGRVKIRYKSEPVKAILYHRNRKAKRVKIVSQKKNLSPTPGQFAVFYKKDICLGGGPIKELIP